MVAKTERPANESLWASVRRYVQDDPGKAAALIYLWLTAVGFARLFGTGMAFGINAIDLSSASDFLLAGFRDPFVGIVGAATGVGLNWLWGKGTTSRNARLALAPTALAVLVICSVGSSAYRRAVITGSWRDTCSAPLTMKVSMKAESTGEPRMTDSIRLVLATGEFLVFYGEPNRTIVLKRDEIVSITMVQHPDQCWF